MIGPEARKLVYMALRSFESSLSKTHPVAFGGWMKTESVNFLTQPSRIIGQQTTPSKSISRPTKSLIFGRPRGRWVRMKYPLHLTRRRDILVRVEEKCSHSQGTSWTSLYRTIKKFLGLARKQKLRSHFQATSLNISFSSSTKTHFGLARREEVSLRAMQHHQMSLSQTRISLTLGWPEGRKWVRSAGRPFDTSLPPIRSCRDLVPSKCRNKIAVLLSASRRQNMRVVRGRKSDISTSRPHLGTLLMSSARMKIRLGRHRVGDVSGVACLCELIFTSLGARKCCLGKLEKAIFLAVVDPCEVIFCLPACTKCNLCEV